jgi:ATP-dependent Lon protease
MYVDCNSGKEKQQPFMNHDGETDDEDCNYDYDYDEGDEDPDYDPEQPEEDTNEEDEDSDDEDDEDDEDDDDDILGDDEDFDHMIPMIIIQSLPSSHGSPIDAIKRKCLDVMKENAKKRKSFYRSNDDDYDGEECEECDEGADGAACDNIFTPSSEHVRKRSLTSTFSSNDSKYWTTLSKPQKKRFKEQFEALHDEKTSISMPLRFKIIESNIDTNSKKMLLARIDHFNMMSQSSSEYFKLRNWIMALDRLPLGKYCSLPIENIGDIHQCASFLEGVQQSLNETTYGHTEAKSQIIRILAQWITNPGSKGHCIGIHGPMGVGKSSLIKEGLSKALNIPFAFIALGGANDGSFLDGHSMTYEGSIYGKLSEVLMKTQCMNPIIFFDELDKVSATNRGDEIIGILTHLTDSVQNEKFNDKYFGELDLDLSKCLIIFSYNDEHLINPILRDRMITIKVKGYDLKDKLHIAKDYLIPDILKQYNLTKNDITFTDEIITKIIQRIKEEEGVRNLRRGIESIVSWMNMYRYVPPTDGAIAFPVTITSDHVNKYIKPDDDALGSKTYLHTMYT